ncbi:DUF3168 domain-containing protein [Pikeienuella sp. HZG-20]|uniref:DUF3168 domain-containing protein n=1 Tax=Paludibacillus litoralis TaxID=3133267 RepID=UPI0030EC9FD2
MTMALSAPLQRALFERLSSAPELESLAGRIYDDAPHRSRDQGAEPYVTLGDEEVSPWNTATDRGAAHEAVIRVYAPQRGFLTVKEIAARIVALIDSDPPAPTRGVVVTHEFINARTRREENGLLRRIDLTFRFVIEDDA